MNRQPKLIAAILMAVVAAQAPRPAEGQGQAKIELEIRNLEARRFQALVQGDVQALDRMLSNDLVWRLVAWQSTRSTL
jgi:hypothetical protein